MNQSLWPQSADTQTLLAQAGNGNLSAINQLLDRHRAALHRMVQVRLDHRVQQRLDVSDVVQDVLLEANQRLSSFLKQPEQSFQVWLRQIAKDHIIDAYRRHRVSAKRSLDREQPQAVPGCDESSLLLFHELVDPGVTPEAQATARELAGLVQASLEKLDDGDREIILLRHYEHLSNQEVAEALQLTTAAASMRYLRAIRRLREVLVSSNSENNL